MSITEHRIVSSFIVLAIEIERMRGGKSRGTKIKKKQQQHDNEEREREIAIKQFICWLSRVQFTLSKSMGKGCLSSFFFHFHIFFSGKEKRDS